MENILDIIKDNILTYEHKVLSLAKAAENSLDVLPIRKEVQKYRDEGIICDLFEGNAPYRPRYILPDYERFMKNGSEFLGLKRPEDIWEAINNLLILYKHVPSITSFPVYIGNIDTLLEPFIEDEEYAFKAIKLFLTHIDRTLTDSFCHANIGPEDTRAGRLILRAEKELQNAVPNLTLKYGPNTSDDLAIEAINTALETAKPSFANDDMFKKEFGEDYGIASCYNGLKVGGGSYTLVRLNLGRLAKQASDESEYIDVVLPKAVKAMAEYMDERVKFLVEESEFFKSSFLVREGLISQDNFSAMFGMFGLAECVNHFIDSPNLADRFGHGDRANELGLKIIERLEKEVDKYKNPYCKASNGRYLLHAQVGIDTDDGISPGCRIPIGQEPEIHQHLLHSAKFHKFFPSGIGDIFNFDTTVKKNSQYILDIIKGSFREGMRYFSLYCSNSDIIRITGYLVKRSEIEKLDEGKQVLHDSVVLGLGSVKNQKVLNRMVRKDV